MLLRFAMLFLFFTTASPLRHISAFTIAMAQQTRKIQTVSNLRTPLSNQDKGFRKPTELDSTTSDARFHPETNNMTLSTTQQMKSENAEKEVKKKNRVEQRPALLGQMPGGRTISNKDIVFDEIDKALGVSKPPDIEVILTDHLTYMKNPITKFLHLNVMRFGHLAIRYTTSDSQQHVMNIQGNFEDEKATMVNFFKPSEYFYGTNPEISQQGGPYNRPFVGVRVERVSKGATDALHAYFQSLQKASEIGAGSKIGAAPGSSSRGAVRFQLVEVNLSKLARVVPAPLDRLFLKAADWIRSQDDKRKYQTQEKVMKSSKNEIEKGLNEARSAIYHAGNCAQWTSGGLDFVGLIRRPRLFPKAVLIDLLEDEYLNNQRSKNVNVVYYSEVEHAAKRDDGAYKCIKGAMVHPLKPTRNYFYDDMKKFASVIVEVPNESDTAQVIRQIPTKYPEPWLNYVTAMTTYVPAGIMLGLIPQIGMLGPTGAAAWLAASWFLY
jgi:uncharacterized FlaG/YvyC family protein